MGMKEGPQVCGERQGLSPPSSSSYPIEKGYDCKMPLGFREVKKHENDMNHGWQRWCFHLT